jgi:hypothetical protein
VRYSHYFLVVFFWTEKPMSRVIKLSTPKHQPKSLPKTAALTKAQAEHKAWLKAHGVKLTKNTLRT